MSSLSSLLFNQCLGEDVARRNEVGVDRDRAQRGRPRAKGRRPVQVSSPSKLAQEQLSCSD